MRRDFCIRSARCGFWRSRKAAGDTFCESRQAEETKQPCEARVSHVALNDEIRLDGWFPSDLIT